MKFLLVLGISFDFGDAAPPKEEQKRLTDSHKKIWPVEDKSDLAKAISSETEWLVESIRYKEIPPEVASNPLKRQAMELVAHSDDGALLDKMLNDFPGSESVIKNIVRRRGQIKSRS